MPTSWRARRAVAQHVHAAGVRRDRAADGRDVARAEIDAVLPARVARLRCSRASVTPGLRGDLAGARVDRTDRVEPPEVEHELAVQRHRTADEPGVPALRDDRDAVPRRRGAARRRPRRPSRAARPRRWRRGTGRSSRRRSRRSTSGSVRTCAAPDRVAQRREQIRRNAHRDVDATSSSRGSVPRSRVPEQRSLRGRLLVAAPPLVDPNFDRTVVLMLEHGDDGGLGIVLNRRSETDARRRVPRVATSSSSPPEVVFAGGPGVDRRGDRARAPAARGDSRASSQILDDLGTVDLADDPLDIGASLESLRVFAGYAGWSPGQLEAELEQGAWFVVAARPARSVRRRTRNGCGATCCAASAAGSRSSRTTPKTQRSTDAQPTDGDEWTGSPT